MVIRSFFLIPGQPEALLRVIKDHEVKYKYQKIVYNDLHSDFHRPMLN